MAGRGIRARGHVKLVRMQPGVREILPNTLLASRVIGVTFAIQVNDQREGKIVVADHEGELLPTQGVEVAAIEMGGLERRISAGAAGGLDIEDLLGEARLRFALEEV